LRARDDEPSARSPVVAGTRARRNVVNNIVWLVGAIVIVLAILSFLGLR
jgi:type VI protein secretion system component VasF